MAKFYCKYCGKEYKTVKDMTFNSCNKNPNSKYHEPYEGSENSKYACKYCGREYKTIKDMTFNSCN
ncbi:MAG: hypothetical protein IIW10_04495, partial [Spirochaetaceae bacterium]|nr:hypothetical protein [Spirochaetaceae bacterium]